jgi:hypothetical protein
MMKQQAASKSRNSATNAYTRALAACCLLPMLAVACSHANAAALTNRDSSTVNVEVMFKSSRLLHELAPNKSLSGFCGDGCIVRLNGSADNDYELEGTERVSIEGGLLYYDGEEIKPKDPDAKAKE